MERDGISIIIPAYNEAGNIAAAVKSALQAVTSILRRYEILIVDDCSFDATSEISRSLARKNSHIKYVRRPVNGGLGLAFLTGVKHARMPFVSWFPGDNDTSGGSLRNLIKVRHEAQIVMAYTVNPQRRSVFRRVVSLAFTNMLNMLFRYHLRYYNGCFVTKTSIVRSVPLISTGHIIFAELKLRLLSLGMSYKEIPFYHIGRKSGVTTAFRWKNIFSIIITIAKLFWEIRIKQT